jgi:hypothetical protein
MKSALFCTLAFLAVLVYVTSASSNPTISQSTLKKIFDNAKPYSDLSSAFYSVKGLELIGEKLPANSLNVKQQKNLIS